MPTKRASQSDRKADDAATRYRSRIRRVRAAYSDEGCDALLVTNERDIRYLTGFRGEDSFAILSGRSITVLSDFRFQEELEAVKPIARVHIRKGGMMDAVRILADRAGVERLAVQAEYMSVHQRSLLAKSLGAKKLKNTTAVVSGVRVIKDAAEIRAIRRAVRIQEKALLNILETIGPGQTELEICDRLESEMKSLGATSASFGTIVAARANGSLPHARPGKTRTGKRQPLLIDWGAMVDGYCSDMCRTFSLGSWPKKLREIYGIVLEAQLAAIDAIRPGKFCAEIDAVAREIIKKAGYGKEFGHSLGHGIGLDIHEDPRLASGGSVVLKPGMVVTVEPGVYIPGLGGVRIEDDIVVTERGASNLCSLPKSIDWATI